MRSTGSDDELGGEEMGGEEMGGSHEGAGGDSDRGGAHDRADGSGAGSSERELWCDTCDAMVPIGDLDEDDRCPTCGETVGSRRIPWKFRLMIAASVVYLGYRLFQGIEWVAHHV